MLKRLLKALLRTLRALQIWSKINVFARALSVQQIRSMDCECYVAKASLVIRLLLDCRQTANAFVYTQIMTSRLSFMSGPVSPARVIDDRSMYFI